MDGLRLATGVRVFYTKDSLRTFVKELLDYYQEEVNRYGEWLGDLIRGSGQPTEPNTDKKAKDPKKKEKTVAKGWTKMGQMLANFSDPNAATTEVLLNVVDDFKQKISVITEVLKSFEKEISNIPDSASYILWISEGVPTRLIVDSGQAKQERFGFSAEFQIV